VVDYAAAERRRVGHDRIRIDIVTGADRFVGGEASALVHWIERGIPMPTRSPPRLSERGLGGRPTLVQNVETLAHLALIVRYGSAWFRSVGTPEEPGSMLVTLLGAVEQPCVREIAIGSPIRDALRQSGGASSPPQALLLGGYFGSWATPSVVDLPFSVQGLAAVGAGPGAGLIAVLPHEACGLAETARVVRYLADESAGQCGPCIFGLDAIADELQRIAEGRSTDTTTLLRWVGQVEGRGACHHPDGAVRLIRSALAVFAPELEQHARGWCRAARPAGVLPVPPRSEP
jgi:NADH:ubiquinone oxidoreductase subunit F (NADH-binding)